MTEPNDEPVAADPVMKPRRTRISWIWLVPIVAALIGLSLLIKGWMSTGPEIVVSFESAQGLEIGQTQLRYKDVAVGVVSGLRVSPDRARVLVKMRLNRDGASYFTQEGARYWVVRPRLGISGVSGLNTLLSGPYIAVDAPASVNDGTPVYKFVGLDKPPEITTGRAGRRFTLSTADLASLEIGSPIYYRRIRVGRVIGYDLNPDGRMVNVHIFVDAPNDKFVTSDTRFWNVSGIDLSLTTSGVSVKTGSLASVVAGGIAFASANPFNETPAPPGTRFTLSDTEAEAMAEPDGVPFRVDMVFRQSVRGLKVGAPIDFRGMELGEVYDIDLEFDSEAKRFFVLVKAHLYPLRFGAAFQEVVNTERDAEYLGHTLLGPMIEHGLRAQIQASNLLTGQQFISLEFFPDAEPVKVDEKEVPLELPTVAGSFDRLQAQLSGIVAKIDAVPFEGISTDLQASLKQLNKLLNTLDKKVAPQLASTLKAAQQSLDKVDSMLSQDSPLNANLNGTLRELRNASKSLRTLSDYLQTHPSAVIRGRPADALPY